MLHLGLLPASIPVARARLQHWLRQQRVEPAEAHDVMLAVTEACTNAVEHAVRPSRPAFDVEATCTEEQIEVAVRDYGRWKPEAGGTTRGRGLSMIRQLMDDAQVERAEDGTRIVMRRVRPALGG